MGILIPSGAGNVTSVNAGSSSSAVLPKPTNTADNDVLVAWVVFRNSSGTITTPAGWIQLGPGCFDNGTAVAYYKPIPSAVAETPTTYTFSTSAGASRMTATMIRVTGLNLASIPDAAGAKSVLTGTSSMILPAVSAVAAYTVLLQFALANNAVTGAPSLFTPQPGTTEISEVSADNGTSATMTGWVGYEILTASGTSGTRVPTISPTASNTNGYMVTLTGIPDVPPASSVRPVALIEATGWSAVGTPSIVTAVSDNLDSTFAQSPTLTSTPTISRWTLGNMVPSPGGINIRCRLSLDVSTTTTTNVYLYEGATLRKQWLDVDPDSIRDIIVNASATDVEDIVDWTDLEVRVSSAV